MMLSENLDPTVRLLLQASEAQGNPPIETLPPAEARKQAVETLKPVGGSPEPLRSVENLRIPGPGGAIPIRVYTPDAPSPGPGLVYFHGGGWVLCDLDTHDVPCSAIARRAGAVVVSVDYRLAPEHKFPAAVEDCYAATVWVAQNAERLGIDRNRISVGGDSAGGNLAAVVALKSRDKNGPAIALQAMVYPVTDLFSFDTDSYREFAEGYQLTKVAMEWFRDLYLSSAGDARNPYASPLLACDLRGLPPALVITAECDPLCDEGEAYAKRLQDAGVPVMYARYPGDDPPILLAARSHPASAGSISAGGRRRAGSRASIVNRWGLKKRCGCAHCLHCDLLICRLTQSHVYDYSPHQPRNTGDSTDHRYRGWGIDPGRAGEGSVRVQAPEDSGGGKPRLCAPPRQSASLGRGTRRAEGLGGHVGRWTRG